MKSPTSAELLIPLCELIAEIRLATAHIESARSKFQKMPSKLPNGARRLDKLSPMANELNALVMNIIMDAHSATWCDDEVHEALEQIQTEFQKGA